MTNHPNQHIEKYLDDFLKLPKSPRFAVLLKGDWGCGKTWFIKKYCQRKEDERNSPNRVVSPGDKHFQELWSKDQKCISLFKMVYVSFFGLSSLSEIDEAIFSELNPRMAAVLSSKSFKITTSVLRGILKGSISLDFDGDKKKDFTFSVDSPELKKKANRSRFNLIVFDDLERCNICPDTLFGYINQLVEVDTNIKVVIVANESKIQDEVKKKKKSKKSRYFEIKEKLIGKTFEVQYDITSSIDSFINEVSHQEVRNFLNEEKNIIIDFFNKGGYQNLRALRQIFFDFERIYIRLPKKVQQKIEIVKEILDVLTILSLEIASNSIKCSQIKELEKAHFGDPSPEEKRYADILQKYNYNYWKLASSCLSLDWWSTFLKKGIIDEQALEDILKSSTYFGDENIPAWQKIWHHTELTDEEFKQHQRSVLESFQNRQCKDLEEFKHVVGLKLLFCEMGISEEIKEDIILDSKQYICECKSHLFSIQKRKALFEKEYGHNLAYYCYETNEFKEIEREIEVQSNMYKIEQAKELIPDFIAVIKEDTYLFSCIINPFESQYTQSKGKEIYRDFPIFEYVDAEMFIKEILRLEPIYQVIRVISAIEARYKNRDYACDHFSGELPFLNTLLKKLEDEINVREGSHTRYHFPKMIEDLKMVISSFESCNELP